MLPQPVIKHVLGSKNVVDIAHAPVFQREGFFSAGEIAVAQPGGLVQRLDVAGAVMDDPGAQPGHALVILRQDLQKPRLEHMILQDPPLALQAAAVFQQRERVGRPELAQGMVDEPAPGLGSCAQHLQILRAEQHRGKQACQIGARLLFHAAHIELPGPPGGEDHRPQALGPLFVKQLRLQIGKFRAEAHQLRLGSGAEALPLTEIDDGFQEIRFPLGVFAHQQIDARRKGRFGPLIAAPVEKSQIFEFHAPVT